MSSPNVIALEHFVANPCYEEWVKLRKIISLHGPACRGATRSKSQYHHGHCNSCPLSFRHTQLLIDRDWHGLCWALETYNDGYDTKAFWDEYQGCALQKIVMFLEFVSLKEEETGGRRYDEGTYTGRI